MPDTKKDAQKRKTLSEILFGKKTETQCGCGSTTVANSCCSSCEVDVSSAIEDTLVSQDCGCGSNEQAESCGCSPKVDNDCTCK
ncbi:hypothetical protein [Ruminiclostridium josui]|uniref:hypothetical protein n=1 Tax=Ruminiclostridium josui TaxID=1499 RepID=UPI000467C3A8|nr:hypothetical protein [Ruminiclostridium josui]